MKMVDVTVLMSTYNGDKYIREQIDSVLAQKNCNIQLVVRDDGSTDDTLQILDEYKDLGKLTYYRGRNLGPAKSFLTMVKESPESDFYAFADQDDIWLPEKIKNAVESLLSMPCNLPVAYCANMIRVDTKNETLEKYMLPQNVRTDFDAIMTVSGKIFGCTMVFNKSMRDFIKNRTIPDYILMHDTWISMIASAYGTLIYDPTPQMRYRTHSDSVSYSKGNPLKNQIKKMFFGSNDVISQECKEFVLYFGEENLKRLDKWNICDLLLNYKTSFIKKLRLQLLVMKKDDLSLKLRIYRSVQIMFNKG